MTTTTNNITTTTTITTITTSHLWEILESAAWLETVLVNGPVLQVLLEDESAAGLDHVELVRPVDVKDGGEVDRVPVKEIFWGIVISRHELITQSKDLIHSVCIHQSSQPGVGVSRP